MANEQNLKPFQKGQSGNPKGGSQKRKGLNAIKKLTLQEVEEIGAVIVKNDLDALQKIAKEKGASVLKVWIASCAAKAIQKGDMGTLNGLLDRLIGKTKTIVEVSGKDGGAIPLSLVDMVKVVEKEKLRGKK